LRGILGR